MASMVHQDTFFTKTTSPKSIRLGINPKDFGKVAVLFGGRSSEREVSLQSGQNVLEALLRQGVDAQGLDLDDTLVEKLMEGQFQRAFIVLHGKEGEDGVVQGLLQMLAIPFTGSGVAASALAMDKARAKLVMDGLQISTPAFGVARTLDQAHEIAQTLTFPICVKPVSEGSSVGVSRVVQLQDLTPAFVKAAQYGDVLLEQWIEGKHLTVSIIGDQIYPAIEIRTPAVFYDYQAKYESDETQYLCPATLNAEETAAIQDLTYRTFHALGGEGWGRVDLIQDQQGKFWVLELNTIPGMTSHSLVPMAAKAMGLSFEDLVVAILETTLEIKHPASKVVSEYA